MKTKLNTLVFWVIAAILALYFTGPVQAAGHEGQCVMQKTKVGKGGMLVLVKPAIVTPTAGGANAEGMVLKDYGPFTIGAETNGSVQLVSAETKKPVGWGNLKDFQQQDLRNCEI